MNIKRRRLVSIFPLILLLFICTPVRTVHSHSIKNYSDLIPVKVTILPCMDPVTTYKKFHTMAHYLEKQINRKIVLQVPRDYSAFIRIIKRQKTDFSFQPAHIYLTFEDYFNKGTILSSLTPAGKRQHHAILITRTDSSIEKIEDLRGKSVLFGPKQSTVKTFAARQLLQQHGIDVETDLHDSSFGSSCEKTAFNVYLKAYDAGFICDHGYNTLMGEENPDWPIPPGSLKIIAQTIPIPTWIFSASRNVDPSTAKSVNEALLSLTRSVDTEHQKVLHSIDSGGFVPTDERDLLTLREQFAAP